MRSNSGYNKRGQPSAKLLQVKLAEQKSRKRPDDELGLRRSERHIASKFKPAPLSTRQKIREKVRLPKVHAYGEVGARALRRAILRGTSPKAREDRVLQEDKEKRLEERQQREHNVERHDARPRTKRPHSPRSVDPELAATWA